MDIEKLAAAIVLAQVPGQLVDMQASDEHAVNLGSAAIILLKRQANPEHAQAKLEEMLRSLHRLFDKVKGLEKELFEYLNGPEPAQELNDGDDH